MAHVALAVANTLWLAIVVEVAVVNAVALADALAVVVKLTVQVTFSRTVQAVHSCSWHCAVNLSAAIICLYGPLASLFEAKFPFEALIKSQEVQGPFRTEYWEYWAIQTRVFCSLRAMHQSTVSN